MKKLMGKLDKGTTLSQTELNTMIKYLENAENALRDINYPPYRLVWMDIFDRLKYCKELSKVQGT